MTWAFDFAEFEKKILKTNFEVFNIDKFMWDLVLKLCIVLMTLFIVLLNTAWFCGDSTIKLIIKRVPFDKLQPNLAIGINCIVYNFCLKLFCIHNIYSDIWSKKSSRFSACYWEKSGTFSVFLLRFFFRCLQIDLNTIFCNSNAEK